MSPENVFILPDGSAGSLCMGPAMDQEMIAELFDNCLAAAAVLKIGRCVCGPEVKAKRQRLAGPKIGSDGRLMEWPQEYREREPGHRHYSPLYALFPGCAITPQGTPELAVAAHKLLLSRLAGKKVNNQNSGTSEWSMSWAICLWSRLGEAQMAHDTVVALLQRCIFPNLLDSQPHVHFGRSLSNRREFRRLGRHRRDVVAESRRRNPFVACVAKGMARVAM